MIPTYLDPVESRYQEQGWCPECKCNVKVYTKDDEVLCADCGGPASSMDDIMDRMKLERELRATS